MCVCVCVCVCVCMRLLMRGPPCTHAAILLVVERGDHVEVDVRLDSAVLFFFTFSNPFSVVMLWSDCNDHQRTMVCQTARVMNMCSYLVPPLPADAHEFMPRASTNVREPTGT